MSAGGKPPDGSLQSYGKRTLRRLHPALLWVQAAQLPSYLYEKVFKRQPSVLTNGLYSYLALLTLSQL